MSGTTSPQELVERALALSRTDGCLVVADETSSANLRWANNTLTTNGVTRGRQLTVVATVDGAQGTACGVVSRAAVTNGEVEELVRAAERAAAEAATNAAADDARPLLTSELANTGTDWDAEVEPTSARAFAELAPALGAAFGRATAADRLLFGFAEHEMTSSFLGTSSGLRLRHDQPSGKVELTAKSTVRVPPSQPATRPPKLLASGVEPAGSRARHTGAGRVRMPGTDTSRHSVSWPD